MKYNKQVRTTLLQQIQQQYRGRVGAGVRCWGSMSEGGGISSAGGDTAKTNLIVNYLPQTMTEKDLYAMFMTIGPIESCRVMKDFKTGYSYGFGFVNFTREEDAARAIDTFNGYQLRNKRLKVSYARPSGEDIKETNLYVTNLPRAITEEQLETIFGKYGRIVQKHILRDKSNGTPRGVAFVRYDKREEAQEAIAALNNVIPEGGTEPLSVKVAEEHGKQKAAYYAGWAAGFHHNRGLTILKRLGTTDIYRTVLTSKTKRFTLLGQYPTRPNVTTASTSSTCSTARTCSCRTGSGAISTISTSTTSQHIWHTTVRFEKGCIVRSFA
ncbi:unnamed protein product [Euphydryas editha]|uniref:RRM domain-containing protein n=1 Tax=Euphydryas editha TaxID=104508 RepID=A0AAU9U629_EUPED|nr:unnamed protein product [Euphydryas editha]